jgi:hypothetical protein
VPQLFTGIAQFDLDDVRFAGIPGNVDGYVPPFIAPATGDYFLRVSSQYTYSILLLNNAALGLEPNDTIATAWPIDGVQASGRRWVVGHTGLAGTDVDHYRFHAVAGHTVVVETYTPAGADGSFSNDLDPVLRLYDASGVLVASDDNSARDGRNAHLEFVVPTTGDYCVAVDTVTALFASENFESGGLGPMWATSSANSNGRIRVTDAVGAADGRFALVMDTRTNTNANILNQAVWTVDLSQAGSAKLNFSHASYADEIQAADGISISGDGTTFVKVWSPPAQPFGVWRQYTVDLMAAARSFGLTLGANSKIRFQQFDNQTYPNDGRGWDAITVTGTRPAGEYVLSIKGDG